MSQSCFTSSGCTPAATTTHKTLRGPRGGLLLTREEHAKAIDKWNFPGTQGGPFMHIIAAKAVCFLEAQSDRFRSRPGQDRDSHFQGARDSNNWHRRIG